MARLVVEQLPPDEVGRCVLTAEGELCRLPPEDLPAALAAGELRVHPGRIRGAWPEVHG